MSQTIQRSKGFSLIESLVTVAITAILAATAVPSFTATIDRQRFDGAINELTLALELARMASITGNARAVIAPLDGANWSSGWHVYLDQNDDGVLDPGERVVRTFLPPHQDITFETHFGAGVSDTAFSYDTIGFIRRPGSHGLVMGRMVITYHGESRVACFSATRVRIASGTTCS